MKQALLKINYWMKRIIDLKEVDSKAYEIIVFIVIVLAFLVAILLGADVTLLIIGLTK